MDEDAASLELSTAAFAHAASLNLQLDSGAAAFIEESALKAGREIAASPAPDQDARLEAAKAAFRILFNEIVSQRSTLQGFAPPTVDNGKITGALQILCPLWPFC